jgi:radical SAM protein with 4Fe4S-binding SPASM domain
MFVDIVFYGGEPTLNYEYIASLIDSHKTSDFPFETRYILHTNGLLLSEIPSTILDNLSVIMLSVNYLCLPRINLNDSYFSKIISGVKHIKSQKDIPIIGRLTITEETSLYLSVMTLQPFFDYFYWQIENCDSFKNFNAFYQSYSYEVKLLADIWINYQKHGANLRLIPFIACVDYLQKNIRPQIFTCGYNSSMIYIQTNGVCYTCSENMMTEKNIIGNISSKIEFDSFSINDISCKCCNYIKLCGGRCARMHKEFSQSHILEYCKLNKVMFDYFIERFPYILQLIKNNNLDISTDDFVYNYTELIP